MSVNWNIFEQQLTNSIESRTAKNEDDFAKLISDTYDRNIINFAADNLLGNRVIRTNKGLLEASLKTAFNLAKLTDDQDTATDLMRISINSGIIMYWTAAQLSLLVPPPGAANVITNMVVSPGIPPDVKIVNTNRIEEFVSELSIKLRIHLMTIQGITTGISPAGTPIILPFVGLN